jgi:hypothetical protein
MRSHRLLLTVIVGICGLGSACVAQNGWYQITNPPTYGGNTNSGAMYAPLHAFAPQYMCVSADGLTLYCSNYGEGYGSQYATQFRLWSCSRPTLSSIWPTPTLVPELLAPITPGALTMRVEARTYNGGLDILFWEEVFDVAFPPQFWELRILHASRLSTASPFGTPVVETIVGSSSNAGWQIGGVDNLCVTEDGLELYLKQWLWCQTAPISGHYGSTIMRSVRASTQNPFPPPSIVPELDQGPCYRVGGFNVSGDGLTVIRTHHYPVDPPSPSIVTVFTRGDRAQPFVAMSTTTVPYPQLRNIDEFVFAESFAISPLGFNAGIGLIWDTHRFTGLLLGNVVSPSTTGVLSFNGGPGTGGLGAVGGLALGTTPGIPLGSRTVPLNYDWLLQASIGGLPGVTSSLVGPLDSMAGFSATIQPVPAGLTGAQVYAAFVVLDPGAPDGISTISNPAIITVFP